MQRSKKKIKELFLEFLQNEAVLQIIQYNKITTQEQKVLIAKSLDQVHRRDPSHGAANVLRQTLRPVPRPMQHREADQNEVTVHSGAGYNDNN